jgi:acyl dehydratase
VQYTDKYFEDYEVGETFERRDVRTITDAEVTNFAGVSGDFHPLHMSDEFAAKTPYGERVAHGDLVFVLAEGLVGETNLHSVSYGHDNLRFVEPVYLGDTLSFHREVIETADYDEQWGRVVYRYTIRNQTDEVVLVDDHITLVEKRPA